MPLGQVALRRGAEDALPPKVDEVAHRLGDALEVLAHELGRRLAEEDVDLLERLVLRLRHEEQLVEPAEHGDAAVEAERQPRLCHRPLHVGEEVRHEPGAEEERHVAVKGRLG